MRVPDIPTHQLGGKLITIYWHYNIRAPLIRQQLALCSEKS